ncbi:unnamed protein product [Diamesa serratosioi]
MSHSVTITRTTTTSGNTSTLILNTGYLKTIPGLLKLAQLILGAVCIGCVAWEFFRSQTTNTDLFFLSMACSFFIGTFCLLVSCLFSLSTGGIISKTIYELIYHSVAFILYLVASILLMIKVTDSRYYSRDRHMIAAVAGLILSALYLISTVFAHRSYRGI